MLNQKQLLPTCLTGIKFNGLHQMNDTDIHWTFAAAYQYGGGFFQNLAKAGLAADPGNKQRILTAFPELVATYGPPTKFHKGLRSGAATTN